MYLLLLLVLAFAAWPLAPTPTWADLSGQVAAEEEEEEGPKFEKVVKDFDHIEGLFDLYRDPEENKVYLAIEPGQFDEIFLCAISRTKGDGYFFDSGSMLFNFPFVFERVGKQVFFTHKNVYYRADQDAAIHRAVDRLSDSVMGATSIEGQPHPETGAVLVDASPLFVQDIDLVDFQLGERDISYGFDGDKSYFGDLKNFLDNTEVDVVLHFATDSPKTNVPTLPDNRSFRHTYHYSLSTLPDTDYQPRPADDRVGHFLTLYQDYTSVLKEDPYVRYVERWHLEKAEPKFKTSKPKTPIVFWLENTVPVEYRDPVREGVLLWNKAFEKSASKTPSSSKSNPTTRPGTRPTPATPPSAGSSSPDGPMPSGHRAPIPSPARSTTQISASPPTTCAMSTASSPS